MVNKVLNKKKDFERIYQKGVKIQGFGISFRYLKNEEKAFRYAFIISKKVCRAHQRNKLKRWGRVVLRQHFDTRKKEIDLLISIHCFLDDFEKFKQTMESLLEEIKSIDK